MMERRNFFKRVLEIGVGAGAVPSLTYLLIKRKKDPATEAESVADFIFNIEPTDTPFAKAMSQNQEISPELHEWWID